MTKTETAVKNEVRTQAYADVAQSDFTNAEYVGRVAEGQVYTTAEGVSFVVRVVVKDVDFDPQFEVDDYAELQAKKAADKAKAKAKAEKAKAEKDKTKAEKEAKAKAEKEAEEGV